MIDPNADVTFGHLLVQTAVVPGCRSGHLLRLKGQNPQTEDGRVGPLFGFVNTPQLFHIWLHVSHAERLLWNARIFIGGPISIVLSWAEPVDTRREVSQLLDSEETSVHRPEA